MVCLKMNKSVWGLNTTYDAPDREALNVKNTSTLVANDTGFFADVKDVIIFIPVDRL